MRRITKRLHAFARLAGRVFRGKSVLGILQSPEQWDAQFERGTWKFLLESQPNTVAIAAYCARRSKELGRPVAICDIGCGNGGLRRALLYSACPISRYTGIDISESALAQAAEFDAEGLYIKHDLTAGFPALPPHDLYIMSEVVYYLPSPARFLSEARAHMPAGSIAVFSLYRSWRGDVVRLFIAFMRKAWSETVVVRSDQSSVTWHLLFVCFKER